MFDLPPLSTTFVIANYDTSLVSACLLGSTQYSVSSFPADDSRVCVSARQVMGPVLTGST